MSQNENLSSTLYVFLRLLNVRVTKTTISKELSEHTDYPSLQAVSDCLRSWHIKNKTFRLPYEKLKQINQPFVAQLKNNEGFICVKSIVNEHVTIIKSNNKEIIIDFNGFIEQSTGIVLLAQVDENSAEPNYKHNRKNEITK